MNFNSLVIGILALMLTAPLIGRSEFESLVFRDSLNQVTIWGKDLFCSSDIPDTLMASQPGGIWTGPGIFNPNIGVFDPGFAREGTHTVYYSIQMGNCEVRDSMIIKVYEQPYVDLGGDTVLCDDEILVINVPTTALNLFWEDGSRDPMRTITETGTYHVELSNVACRVSDTINVLFDASPNFDLGNDIDTCAEEILLIGPANPNWTYTWQDGSSTDNFIAEENGTYSLRAESVCGSLTESIQLYLDECECRVFMPNAFSPDGNGINDLFEPVFQSECTPVFLQLRIYNRWGELVHDGENNNLGWRGLFRNEKASADVYTYHFHYELPSGKKKQIIGEVTLIK